MAESDSTEPEKKPLSSMFDRWNSSAPTAPKKDYSTLEDPVNPNPWVIEEIDREQLQKVYAQFRAFAEQGFDIAESRKDYGENVTGEEFASGYDQDLQNDQAALINKQSVWIDYSEVPSGYEVKLPAHRNVVTVTYNPIDPYRPEPSVFIPKNGQVDGFMITGLHIYLTEEGDAYERFYHSLYTLDMLSPRSNFAKNFPSLKDMPIIHEDPAWADQTTFTYEKLHPQNFERLNATLALIQSGEMQKFV